MLSSAAPRRRGTPPGRRCTTGRHGGPSRRSRGSGTARRVGGAPTPAPAPSSPRSRRDAVELRGRLELLHQADAVPNSPAARRAIRCSREAVERSAVGREGEVVVRAPRRPAPARKLGVEHGATRDAMGERVAHHDQASARGLRGRAGPVPGCPRATPSVGSVSAGADVGDDHVGRCVGVSYSGGSSLIGGPPTLAAGARFDLSWPPPFAIEALDVSVTGERFGGPRIYAGVPIRLSTLL